MPAKRAARALAPTARISKPNVVRALTHPERPPPAPARQISPECTRVRSSSLPNSSSAGARPICGQPIAVGILHRAVEHHRHEQQHDEIEQQRGHDLVDAEPRLEPAPGRAAAARRQPSPAAIISGNSTTGGSGDRAAADRDRGERADVELALRRRCCRSCARNATAAARPVRISGVARVSVSRDREARAERAVEQQRVGAPDRRAGPGDEQRAQQRA